MYDVSNLDEITVTQDRKDLMQRMAERRRELDRMQERDLNRFRRDYLKWLDSMRETVENGGVVDPQTVRHITGDRDAEETLGPEQARELRQRFLDELADVAARVDAGDLRGIPTNDRVHHPARSREALVRDLGLVLEMLEHSPSDTVDLSLDEYRAIFQDEPGDGARRPRVSRDHALVHSAYGGGKSHRLRDLFNI